MKKQRESVIVDFVNVTPDEASWYYINVATIANHSKEVSLKTKNKYLL